MISGSTHQDVYQNVETLNCWPQVDTIGSSPITRLYSSHTFEVPPDCVSWRSSPKKQQFINSSLFTNLKINQNPSKSIKIPIFSGHPQSFPHGHPPWICVLPVDQSDSDPRLSRISARSWAQGSRSSSRIS